MNQSLIFPLLIVVLAVPLFLSYRKQKKMASAQKELQNSIGEGDRVMTTSGLYATVISSGDTTIDLEIAPGVVTTWLRQAVREKVNTDAAGESTDSDNATEPSHAETPAHEVTSDSTTATVAPPLEQR
jgi:preprotein translocase subunit YajC